MHISGFIAEKPIVGGLEHEVTKKRNSDFCCVLNSDSTVHKSTIV
jgi:hypothetical protein